MASFRARVLATGAAVFVLFVPQATVTAAPAYGLTGGVSSYIVAPGDTLARIGSRAGVDPATLAAANGLRLTARLKPGTVLQIDNRHVVPADAGPRILVVNVPQRMLFFDDGTGMTAFPVAVGRSTWRTPLGPFRIVKREVHPSWEVPASIRAEAVRAGHVLPSVVPPGPDNPLGDFWLGLSVGGVGIHGTNMPSSIYRVATHGCIRLHPDDIAALFPRVPLDTTGRIVYEPVLLAVVAGDVWVEVHRDVYRRDPDVRADVERQAAVAGAAEAIDWRAVDAAVAAHEGIARLVTRKNPRTSERLPQPAGGVPPVSLQIRGIAPTVTWPAS